jgi:hypothetical protein
MRNFLSLMPAYLSKNSSAMPAADLYKLILSNFAKNRDNQMSPKFERKIKELQNVYMTLVQLASKKTHDKNTLEKIKERALILNSEKRITGNALINIVEFILQEKNKELPPQGIQRVIDRLIGDHLDIPEVTLSRFYKKEFRKPLVPVEIIQQIQNIVLEFKDDI